MRTLLPLLAVLLSATSAVANAPPPGVKYSREVAVITLAEPAGEWTYFAEPSNGSGLQKLGNRQEFTIPSPGWSAPYLKPFVVVWAVRTSECLGVSDSSVADRLNSLQRRGLAICSERVELGYWRSSWSSLLDVNDGIEKHYRLERTETELKLHPLGERPRPNGFAFVVCGAVAVGVVLLVAWLMWRRRKARVTRTTPPPGN